MQCQGEGKNQKRTWVFLQYAKKRKGFASIYNAKISYKAFLITHKSSEMIEKIKKHTKFANCKTFICILH